MKDERLEKGETKTKKKETAKKKKETAKKEDSTKKKTAKKEEVAKKETAKEEENRRVRLRAPVAVRVTWGIISRIVMLAIVLVCIIIAIQKVTNNEKSFFGYRIFRVQTGSMTPKYSVGDVILVKETAIDKLKIGDDVTYHGETGAVKGIMVTHRIVDIEEIDGQRAFHTQGIANNLEDPIVYGSQINGVVQTKMYILTLLCRMLENKYVFYFCGVVPLSIYLIFRVYKHKSNREEELEGKS